MTKYWTQYEIGKEESKDFVQTVNSQKHPIPLLMGKQCDDFCQFFEKQMLQYIRVHCNKNICISFFKNSTALFQNLSTVEPLYRDQAPSKYKDTVLPV